MEWFQYLPLLIPISAAVTLAIWAVPLSWIPLRSRQLSDYRLANLEAAASTIARPLRWCVASHYLVGAGGMVATGIVILVLHHALSKSVFDSLKPVLLWWLSGWLFWLLVIMGPFWLFAVRFHNGVFIPALLERLRRNARRDSRAPVLFLRSFSRGTLWGYSYTGGVRSGPIPVSSTATYNYLDGVARALSPIAPLLCIGGGLNKDEHGFAVAENLVYLTCDQHRWRDLFLFAAERALSIVIAPASTTGLTQEIRDVVSRHWSEKTLVFMPPAPHRLGARENTEHAMRRTWQKAQTAWAKHGFMLPDYETAGMLYLPQTDFSIRSAVALSDKRDAIRVAIDTLLPQIPRRTGAVSDVVAFAHDLGEQRGSWRVVADIVRWVLCAVALSVAVLLGMLLIVAISVGASR